MKWIDSHIHVDQYKDEEKSRLLKEVENSKEIKGLIAVSMNYQSCKETLSLAKKYPFIYPAIGFHPEQQIHKEECEQIYQLIEQNAEEIVAIGEVGLPYYLRKEDERIAADPYIAVLKKFIELASKYNLPIVLHAVYEDADIVCDLLEKYKVSRAHFHWFKGSDETMKRMMKNGYYISITPDVLQKEKNEVKMKDIHITTNKDGIHVEKPTSANDIIDYIKQYGFFLMLGFVIIVFLLLLKRAKKLES